MSTIMISLSLSFICPGNSSPFPLSSFGKLTKFNNLADLPIKIGSHICNAMENYACKNPVWNNGRINANDYQTVWSFVAMALVWNAFSIPFFYLILSRHYHSGWDPVLLLGLFPLIGIVLAYFAVLQMVRWVRLKALTLDLDPFPGSIGGDIGGTIKLPLAYAANHQFELSLECKQTHAEPIWQEQGKVVAENLAGQSCIKFRFAVPDGLPESDQNHVWRLRLGCDLPGLKFTCFFVVPVYQTLEKLNTTGVAGYTPAQINKTSIPHSIVELSQLKNARRLYYPSTRNYKMGIALLISSLVLMAVCSFADLTPFASTWLGQPAASIIPILLVLFTFSLTVSTIYVFSNTLEIFFTFDKVITVRRILGIPFERSISTGDICQLIRFAKSPGDKDTQTYLLKAKTADGQHITLGDGIHDAVTAQRIQQLIRETLNTSLDWTEASNH